MIAPLLLSYAVTTNAITVSWPVEPDHVYALQRQIDQTNWFTVHFVEPCVMQTVASSTWPMTGPLGFFRVVKLPTSQ